MVRQGCRIAAAISARGEEGSLKVIWSFAILCMVTPSSPPNGYKPDRSIVFWRAQIIFEIHQAKADMLAACI